MVGLSKHCANLPSFSFNFFAYSLALSFTFSAFTSVGPFSKNKSVMFQKAAFDCCCAHLEATAACSAQSWPDNGKCLKISRICFSVYTLNNCSLTMLCASWQCGHCRSEYSTMVTGASMDPFTGTLIKFTFPARTLSGSTLNSNTSPQK